MSTLASPQNRDRSGRRRLLAVMIRPSQGTTVEEVLRLFGQRIRAARKAAKLSIEAAAERANLRPTFLGEIERAEKRPSFQTIVRLAAALGVAPIVFFQFGRAETDAVVLRQAIQKVLQGSSALQLQQAYRVIQAVFEPQMNGDVEIIEQ